MQACEALGLSDFSKIFKHLIPNVLSMIIVNATLSMASAILTEAGLSFLGMGVTAPTPSWGNLMELARNTEVFQDFPWNWLPAGIMCLLTVISINLMERDCVMRLTERYTIGAGEYGTSKEQENIGC